jgi:hypothetical protein
MSLLFIGDARGPLRTPDGCNDMPDVDGKGPYSVPSWTLFEYAGNNRWSREEDIYNPDAMLKMLGRWCDAAGVPFPAPDIQA